MSRVTCHMSRVTCNFFFLLKKFTKWWSYSVEGLLSTGPTPSSLLTVRCFCDLSTAKITGFGRAVPDFCNPDLHHDDNQDSNCWWPCIPWKTPAAWSPPVTDRSRQGDGCWSFVSWVCSWGTVHVVCWTPTAGC